MSSLKYSKLLVAPYLALSMLACVTITLTDIGHLRKGMTIEEAKATLPLPPKSEFPLETSNSNVNYEVCTYIVSSGNYGSNYFLAFQDSRLFFWGYPHEFARSANALINEIGEKAVAAQAKLDEEARQKQRMK